MLFSFTYKPLGKVQKRLIEAPDLETAQIVAAKYCEQKNLQLIPQSVEPAIVADESILTKADLAGLKERQAERRKAAEKESAALKRQEQEAAKDRKQESAA